MPADARIALDVDGAGGVDVVGSTQLKSVLQVTAAQQSALAPLQGSRKSRSKVSRLHDRFAPAERMRKCLRAIGSRDARMHAYQPLE